MKLVVAIIRPEKLPEVLEALYRLDVRGITASRVHGHGGELERVETYRGTTVKMELSEKVRLEVGVSDPLDSPPWLTKTEKGGFESVVSFEPRLFLGGAFRFIGSALKGPFPDAAQNRLPPVSRQ